MNTKRSGIFGALETIGLVEGETHVSVQEDALSVAPPSPPVPFQVAPTDAAPLNADDLERFKALEAQVYATPSSYVIFQKVRETLGGTADPKSVFRVLNAANPGITPTKVMADIDTHLGIIASKRAEFDGQVAQARHDRIDGPTAEIESLQRANDDAKAQVVQRIQRIQQIQTDANVALKSITDGTVRFVAVETRLSAPLLQAKQLLTGLV